MWRVDLLLFPFAITASLGHAQLISGTSWKRLNPAVAWIQKVEINVTTVGATVQTPAFASSTTTGNAIICSLIFANASSSVSSVADSAGNTYTAAVNSVETQNSGINQAIYYNTNITGGASVKVTATFAGTNGYREFSCHEFSGVIPAGALDASAISGSTSTTTSVSAGPLAANYTKEFIFANVNPTTGAAAGSGFTSISTLNGNLVEYKVVTAPGSYSILATLSPTSTWNAVYATFRSR